MYLRLTLKPVSAGSVYTTHRQGTFALPTRVMWQPLKKGTAMKKSEEVTSKDAPSTPADQLALVDVIAMAETFRDIQECLGRAARLSSDAKELSRSIREHAKLIYQWKATAADQCKRLTPAMRVAAEALLLATGNTLDREFREMAGETEIIDLSIQADDVIPW